MSSYLTAPLEKGRLRLKNRLVMPPMATGRSEADGEVGQKLLAYYDEKTKGGYLSLVIIEHSYVSMVGKANPLQLSASEGRMIPGLKRLADTIHKNGSKAVLQINHAGSAAKKAVTGFDPVGPSAVQNPSKEDAELPVELSRSEIELIVHDFADAAVRAKNAGFDGVEIHSAHGYLLDQFISPLTNRRNDSYGGGIHGRTRIHLEIIGAVRRVVGNDFPILLRYGATDQAEGGLTPEDSVAAALAFEKAGVDMIDISGGMCRYTVPGNSGPGYFSRFSQAVKEAVSVPVMVTGGVTRAAEAEELLKNRCADLIGVGRAILKDSGWAKAALESLN